MEISKLNPEWIETKKLKPYKKNAKKHNETQIKNIAQSLAENGWTQAVMVDEDYTIIYGHGRVQACQYNAQNGVKSDFVKDWISCPVIICDWLTEEQKRKYRLLDNKLNESEWDFDLLNTELPDLDFSDFDIDWGILNEEEETAEVIEDDYDVEPPEEPKSKYGDIYQLGRHRLMCGDSTKQEDVEKLMNGEKADMVFTDPPYGMKKENDGVANDNLNYDDLLEFNKKWIPLSFKILKNTGSWYCWGIDEPLMDIYSNILKPMKKSDQIVIRNYITWAKHSAFGINSDIALSYPRETEKAWFVMKGQDWNNNNADHFNTKYERILDYLAEQAKLCKLTPKDIKEICGVQMYSHWFTKSQFTIIPEKHYKKLQKHKNAFAKSYNELVSMLGKDDNKNIKPYFDNIASEKVGDIGLTDVWRFSTTSNKERKYTGGHATPKPIALCSRAIKASTRINETVVDFFGGSGTTLVACEQMNRNCLMLELEPKWIDVIIDRWEQFTGEKAVLINE